MHILYTNTYIYRNIQVYTFARTNCCLFDVWNRLRRRKNLLFYRFQRKEWLNYKSVENNNGADTIPIWHIAVWSRWFFVFFLKQTRKTSQKIWSTQSLPKWTALLLFLLLLFTMRIFNSPLYVHCGFCCFFCSHLISCTNFFGTKIEKLTFLRNAKTSKQLFFLLAICLDDWAPATL